MAFWWVVCVMASIVYMVYWDHVFCIYSVLVSFYRREFINWIWILSKPTKQNYKIDKKKILHFTYTQRIQFVPNKVCVTACYFVYERCFNPAYFSSMTKTSASFNLMLVNSWKCKVSHSVHLFGLRKVASHSSSSGVMSVPSLDFL